MSTLNRYTLHSGAGRRHHPVTSRVTTTLCPCLGVLWEAAQLTSQKWATFINLLCCIFLVTAQMILCPGESESEAWWEHPGCWITGSCWHSWKPPHKTRTTWRLPHSERSSHKRWITLPKECSVLKYSVGKNVTSGKTSFVETSCGLQVEHLHCTVKWLKNALALLYLHIQITIFLWKQQKADLSPHTMLVIIDPASPSCVPWYFKTPRVLPLVLFSTHLCLTKTRYKSGHERSVSQMSFPISASSSSDRQQPYAYINLYINNIIIYQYI